MAISYINKRGREIILVEESTITGNIVVNDLIYAGIIQADHGDKAAKIVSDNFVVYRTGKLLLSEEEIEESSYHLGTIIIDQMIQEKIIKSEDRVRATEIASEEIMVRLAIESV